MKRLPRSSLDSGSRAIAEGREADDLSQGLVLLAKCGVESHADILALVRRRRAPRLARATGCRVLGRLGGKGVREALIQQVQSDSSSLVYWEAAKALALLGDRRAIGPLGKLVNARVKPDRRAAAAYALGMMGERSATKSLMRTVRSVNTPAPVRAYVVEALGLLDAVESRELITDLLTHDRSPQVRAAAAYALGRVGNRESLATLRRAAEADSAIVAHLGAISAIAQASTRNVLRRLSRRNPRRGRVRKK
jgi:HEAT repeat protein